MIRQIQQQPPQREIRASFDDETLVLYQAYEHDIADAALRVGTFVSPFKFNRMTWLKPSFLWMMYRSGWATKPSQERILALRVRRSEFNAALAEATLSQFEPRIHSSKSEWRREIAASSVRLQWDPERSLSLHPLPWRTLQLGVSGKSLHNLVSQWIVEIDDVTEEARNLHEMVKKGHLAEARSGLPFETRYPIGKLTALKIGVTDL